MATGPNTEFFVKHGLIVGGNTRVRVAVGNTAQRPANAQIGDTRYNTDLDRYEGYYANGVWGSIAPMGTLDDDVDVVSSLTVGNSTQNVATTTSRTTWNGGASANSLGFYSGAVSVNSAGFYHGVVVVNSTMLGVGNSTVNLLANSTHLFFTGGASHKANSTTDYFGNSTVYHLANTTVDLLVTAVGNAGLYSTGLKVDGGNVTVNSSGLYVSTSLYANATSFFSGNSTQNSVVNSSGIYINGVVSGTESSGTLKYSYSNLSSLGYLDQTNRSQTLSKATYPSLYSAVSDVWMPNTVGSMPSTPYWIQDSGYFTNSSVLAPQGRFLNGEFMFFGSGINIFGENVARIWYSTDGIHFKNTVPFTTPNVHVIDLAYGNGLYVALGAVANLSSGNTYSNVEIARSSDLLTWTLASAPGTNSTMSTNSIEYGNGTFLIVGNTYGIGNGFVLTSTDANTWSVSFESSSMKDALMSVYNGQGYWFVGCRSANLSMNGIWASGLNDTSTFTRISNGVYSNSTANVHGWIAAMGVGDTDLGEVVWVAAAANTSVPTITAGPVTLVRATNNSTSSITQWSSDFYQANNNATNFTGGISAITGNNTISINRRWGANGFSASNFSRFPNRIVFSKNTYSFTYQGKNPSIIGNNFTLTATIDAVNTAATWNLATISKHIGSGQSGTAASDLVYSPTTDKYMAVVFYNSTAHPLFPTYSIGRPDTNTWFTTVVGGGAYSGVTTPTTTQVNTVITSLNGNLVSFTPASSFLSSNLTSASSNNFLWLEVSQSADQGNTWTRCSQLQVNALASSSATHFHDAAYGNGTYVVLTGVPRVGTANSVEQLNLYYTTNLQSSWAQSTITPSGWAAAPVQTSDKVFPFPPSSTYADGDVNSINRVAYGNGNFYVGTGYWSNSTTIATNNNLSEGWMYGNGSTFAKSGNVSPAGTAATFAFPQYSNGILAFSDQANGQAAFYSTDGVTPVEVLVLGDKGANLNISNVVLEAAGGGQFIYSAVGAEGRFLTVTSDFQTWTTVTDPPFWPPGGSGVYDLIVEPAGDFPHGITYVQNTFVKFGYNYGTYHASKNGVDWFQDSYQFTTTQATTTWGTRTYISHKPYVVNNYVYSGLAPTTGVSGALAVFRSEAYFSPKANSSQFNLPKIPAPAPGLKSWVKT